MTDVVSLLVGKVVDYLCGVAKTEITYILNRSENVGNLKNEVKKLSSMKGRVQQQIDLAKSKGERLLEGVEEWMEKAQAEIVEATEFISEETEAKKSCFNIRLCVNLSTRLHYSKMATKKTYFLRQHQVDGKDFETRVSLPSLSPGFADLYPTKNLENIDAQKSTLKKIIEAIEDDTIQIVGINGLGGVGKTTLASEAAAKMKNRFADIVFITVSQNVNAKMIQEKVKEAASKIINGDKVLIILDDVWKELKLEEVGIPCGRDYMNCKILLTSRSIDVCEAMNAQKNISVNPLKYDDAWALFEHVVGKSEWDNSLKEVASKIVEECGGLPLFVQAVGKALRNKEIKSWEAALGRLQDPTDEDAPFKIQGVMQLKLSYDYLESEVAKSCFLLCSMFPEDQIISLESLAYYGLALRIFNNPDCNIEDSKYRVQVAIDSLKSSFLLFPGNIFGVQEEIFKMHDLVRDMAILITSKGDDKFWVQSGKDLIEWQPKKHFENYKKISLMGNKIRKLPNHELNFPHLDTFLIQDNQLLVVDDEFFQGMEKLKILDMSRNMISSLPQSLRSLRQLVMLALSGNQSLVEICILGELTCLEILKLRNTGIKNIPKEIGQLTNLRLIDVSFCKDLSYVAPGVISKLIWLEELHLWMIEGDCNFLVELNELKSLKILHLTVPDLDCIPEDFDSETLIEFYIMDDFYYYPKHPSKRILHISKASFPFTMPIMRLIQLSGMLVLWEIEKLDNVLPGLYGEGYDELKHIQLKMCDNVRSLVKTCDLDSLQISVTSNELGQRKTKGKFFSKVEVIQLVNLNRLEVLWDSSHQHISFCNLRSIDISYCPSLLELFPVSVARGLVNLRELKICYCESLVVVVSAEAEQRGGSEIELVNQDPDIVFSLTDIHLIDLPKLESFYSGRSIIKYHSLKLINAYNCPSMKRWSYGDTHIPNLNSELQGLGYNNINNYVALQHEKNKNSWTLGLIFRMDKEAKYIEEREWS